MLTRSGPHPQDEEAARPAQGRARRGERAHRTAVGDGPAAARAASRRQCDCARHTFISADPRQDLQQRLGQANLQLADARISLAVVKEDAEALRRERTIDAQKIAAAESQREAALAEARRHAVDHAEALRQRADAFAQVAVLHQQAAAASAAHRRELDQARTETPQLCAEIEALSKSNTDMYTKLQADRMAHERHVAKLNDELVRLRAANAASDRLLEDMRAKQLTPAVVQPTPRSDPAVLASFRARLQAIVVSRAR